MHNPAHYRREVVGFVFQLHHLLPSLSAQQNVELPLVAGGVGRAEPVRKARNRFRADVAGLPFSLFCAKATSWLVQTQIHRSRRLRILR